MSVLIKDLNLEERQALLLFLTALEREGHQGIRLFRYARWTWGAVRRDGFTWTLVRGELERQPEPEDVWLYSHAEDALDALAAWSGRGEPLGWTRHLATRRYRPGANPAEERVEA